MNNGGGTPPVSAFIAPPDVRVLSIASIGYIALACVCVVALSFTGTSIIDLLRSYYNNVLEYVRVKHYPITMLDVEYPRDVKTWDKHAKGYNSHDMRAYFNRIKRNNATFNLRAKRLGTGNRIDHQVIDPTQDDY